MYTTHVHHQGSIYLRIYNTQQIPNLGSAQRLCMLMAVHLGHTSSALNKMAEAGPMQNSRTMPRMWCECRSMPVSLQRISMYVCTCMHLRCKVMVPVPAAGLMCATAMHIHPCQLLATLQLLTCQPISPCCSWCY